MKERREAFSSLLPCTLTGCHSFLLQLGKGNQKLCKLTPAVTQYHKARKRLVWVFFFFFWSPGVGCRHDCNTSNFVSSSISPARGFILKIPKHRGLCWHCHQQLMAESRVRSRSTVPPGSAPAKSKCRKKCGDWAEMETIVKNRRFKWSREFTKLIKTMAKKGDQNNET